MEEILFDSNKQRINVSFGTTLGRELLPLKPPHTRSGNELGIRGVWNLGPGSYDSHEVSGFVYALQQKPHGKKGYSLGARTATRFPRDNDDGVPGPPAYQEVNSKPKNIAPAFKPFQCSASRFPAIKCDATPGPGAYDHGVEQNRKMQFHGSFGGLQTLKPSITLICHQGEPDKCLQCNEVPFGDYRKYKTKAMCRKCYNGLINSSSEKFPMEFLKKFEKVRDCRHSHGHEGTNAKLRLLTDRDIKKQRNREAYMSLYYG